MKLQYPEGLLFRPGALVLYYITGTKPDGSSIVNPEQYLSSMCGITDSTGLVTTTLQNAVPGNYYINAQAECADPGLADAPSQVKITVTSPVTPPVASFSYQLNYNGVPRQVFFDASLSSAPAGISSYSWNFDDGSSGQGVALAHTFQNPGTYTITLTVTDRGSPAQSGTYTRQIFFQNPVTSPVADFTLSTTSGPAPIDLVITDASTGNPTDWAWTMTGPIGAPPGPIHQRSLPSYRLDTPGTVTVTLTVSNSAGSSSKTRTVTVHGTSKPVASFSYQLNYNGNPRQVLFDASTSSDPEGISSYSWNFGDGSSGQGVTVAHTFQNPGTYTITLTVTDMGSPTMTAFTTRQITVGGAEPTPGGDTKPQVKLTFRQSTDTGATANSITGDASASTDPDGILVYYWNWGDGTKVEMGTIPVLSHTYASPGQYTVSVSAIDSKGESGSTSQQVTIPIGPSTPLEPLLPLLALIAGAVILLRRRT